MTAGESVSTAASDRSKAFLTAIDQVLSSGSNALLLFVLAQIATVAEFGVVALLAAIFTSWVAFNRGAVGAAILLVSNLRKREILIESGYAMSFTAIASFGAVALACLTGVATGKYSLALAFAIILPAVLVQDVLRVPPIACGKPMIAVLSDGFWVLFMLGLFIAHLAGATVSLEVAILLWGLAGLISATMLAIAGSVKPKFHRLWGWWRTYSQSRIRFGGTYAMTALSSAATILLVTAIAGTVVVGVLRGGYTLLGPISMLMLAVPMAFVPHVRRSSTPPRAQWRLLTQTSIAGSVLTVVCIVLLLLIPGELGTHLLGKVWGPAVSVLPYIGIESAATFWMFGIYSWLQAQGMGRMSFRFRLLQGGVQLGACAIAASIFGSAIPIAISLASSCWLMVLIGVAIVERALNSTTGSAHSAPLTADRTRQRNEI
jgi:O-antigen/teichoic acid export membrane protein